MVKEFNNLEEIQQYYDKNTNTYIFKENGNYIIELIKFKFDLNIEANIKAYNIDAYNITAYNIDTWNITANNINVNNINACDINAKDIKAHDIIANDIKANSIVANKINYYAVCWVYENIKCKSISGRKNNAKHFVLNGKLEVK